MFRRPLAVLLLVTGLVMTGTTSATATRFVDVPDSHVFATQIEWLADEGITTGYADGTFRPGAAVLREQMAVFLWRQAGQPAVSDLPGTSPFTDVPRSHAFYQAIVWLADSGISTGYDDGSFRPGQPVLREQMAAFLYRFRALQAAPGSGSGSFVDVPSGRTFAEQIRWLSGTGISTGYSDGTFRPSQPVLREQMAAFLFRFDDRFGSGDGAAAGPFTSQPTPTISGAAVVGTRLRGTPGTWTPQPTSVTYQWLRNGSPISGATSIGYTVKEADLGATLTFRATATRAGASASVRTSAATAAVTRPAVPIEVQRILDDTNRFRAQQGKPALQLSQPMSQVAQNWSAQMATTCDFRHNPSYASQIPGGWRAAAENIAAGQQYTTVVQAWINSAGHRANLEGDFTHIGIGYTATSPCGLPRTFVQVFARY
ncbi:S-layer homology domain-containing protein [Aeromicrobium alkaliterrae]|uniref:SLH domain-containing protein n=1 Tax=Aeromicrobium alkaliterrae TaxID=302168 RepID=A0ABN2JK89_9ACTN